MNISLSTNTQVILLLTAPLIAGRNESSPDLLTPNEYKRLARLMREKQLQPADLLVPDSEVSVDGFSPSFDGNRLKRLLARGFLLSQAVDRWQSRAIWVVSRADAEYPRRIKTRLKDDAPPVLYGCGDQAILDTGGLAVVGSRHVDEGLIKYTEGIGELAAKAGCTVISGGARGIDQAAMRGALEAGGKAVGILADSLERMALTRENRSLLMNRQLVLISPYDPLAGFNVGHAMQRNKLIYALANAAFVVSSDYNKGGTWAGAVEQLEKLRLVPLYVRSNGGVEKGLNDLRNKGALPWPDPETPETLMEVLSADVISNKTLPLQNELSFAIQEEPEPYQVAQTPAIIQEIFPTATSEPPPQPAEELFAKVRELIEKMKMPKTETEVAADLQVSKGQAKEWLQRLVKEGVMEKYTKPVRYGLKSQRSLLQ